MDPTDPLADTSAPRYAIESDEEEDEPNPLRPSIPVKTPEIKIIGTLSPGNPLIVASARAGAYWARGADLGEQQGGVYIDNIQVGLLFTPAHYSPCTVLISEPHTTLPLSYQSPYAQHVLASLRPSRVALLDTYSAPAYASESGEGSLHEAPVRWISTSEEEGEWTMQLNAQPFAPPNLLQTTSAAFILSSYVSSLSSSSSSPSSTSTPTSTTTALLLPTLHYPVPPPKTLLPSHTPLSSSEDHEDSWSAPLMQSVSEVLTALVQIDAQGITWKAKGKDGVPPPAKQRSEIGEGGMYL